MNKIASCPDSAFFQMLSRGELSSDDITALGHHADKCPACVQRLANLGSVASNAQSAQIDELISKCKSSSDIFNTDVVTGDASTRSGEEVPAAEAADDELAFLSPPQGPNEIGRLGVYRVIRLLGQGGMGLVLEAEDIHLKRRVALKVMKPEIAVKKQHRERFLREAQAAARVEHDHIIPIHQIGEANGVPFIAMPFLKGEPLDARLKRGRLDVSDIIAIGRQTAEGLAAAHEEGLIHRDIKPANIWLEAGSNSSVRVKILDFGLARLSGDEGNLTQSGMILGTPAYMSPEQARSRPVDHRADLFSLGCVLYEMSTGKRPFTGTDTMGVLSSLALDTPAEPASLNPDLPPTLSALIMKLLEKDANRRPQKAGDAARVLKQLMPENTIVVVAKANRESPESPWADIDDTEMISAPELPAPNPTEKERSLKPWWIGLGALAVAMIAGIIFLVVRDKNGKDIARNDAPKNKDVEVVDPNKKDRQKIDPIVPVAAVDYALLFEGGAQVQLPDMGLDVDKPFTLEAFVRVDKLPLEDKVAASVVKITPVQSNLSLGKAGNWNFLRLGCPANDTSSIKADFGKRIHLAGAYDGSELYLFVDGKRVATHKASRGNVPEPKKIGFIIGDSAFVGLIDEVRISKIARYDKNFTPAKRFEPDLNTLALYHFDEGTGDVLTDSSGNNHHGKIVGAKWMHADGTPIGAPAASGNALIFNGQDAAVEIPSLRYDGSHPLTIESWVRSDKLPEKGVIVDQRIAGWDGVFILGRNTDFLACVGYDNDGKYQTSQQRLELDDFRRFHHVAGVWDGKQLCLFLDGKAGPIIPMPSIRDTSKVVGLLRDHFAIGCTIPVGVGNLRKPKNYFEGIIRATRVSKTARYDKDFTPAQRFESDKDTLALYHFDEGAGDVLKDSSNNGHHGKIVGAKWVKVDGPPEKTAESTPLTWSMVQKFEGHTDAVRSVAMSRDGKFAVTGSLDGTAILWDAISGKKLQTFPVYTGKGVHMIVAVSDDGKIVATGDHGSVTVWDAVNNKVLQTFKRPPGNPNIHCLALSRDGKQVLIGSGDGKARLWETTTGKIIQTFDGQSGSVNHVSLSVDAKRVLTSTWSNIDTVTLWDVATGKPIQTLTERGGSAVFSDDAKLILTRAKDGKEAILWDAAPGNPLKNLKGHTFPIAQLALSGDGRYALAGPYDDKAILWDTANGKQLQSLKGHTAWVLCVALSGDGKYALTGSDDKTAILWAVNGEPGPWQPLLDDGLSRFNQAAGNPPGAIAITKIDSEPVLRFKPDGKVPYVYSKMLVQNSHVRLQFQLPSKVSAEFSIGYGWPGGTSGIQLRIPDSGASRLYTYGMKANAGSLERGTITSTGKANGIGNNLADANLQPAGKWNQLDMVRVDDRVAFFVNGRFVNALADIRGFVDGAEMMLGEANIKLHGGGNSGEVLVRRIEVREISAFRPESIEPGPWQPLLDAKLTNWERNDSNEPPDRISLEGTEAEPVVRLRSGAKSAYLHNKKEFHNHHLALEFQLPPDKGLNNLMVSASGGSARGLEFRIGADARVWVHLWNNSLASPGFLDRGAVASKGAKSGDNIMFPGANLKPAGTWNRLDVVRLEDSMVCFVNGRFAGAVAGMRQIKDGKEAEFGAARFDLASREGEVRVRGVKVRDISALPPELLAPDPWQPLLDAKLTDWEKKDANEPPDRITLEGTEAEPVLRLRRDDKNARLESKKEFHNHHLGLEFQFPPGKGPNNLVVAANRGSAGGLDFRIGNDASVWIGQWPNSLSSPGILNGGTIGIRNGKNFTFPGANLKPAGTWNRLDVVRLKDSMVCFINGRFAGAMTDMRLIKDGKETEFGAARIHLASREGEVRVRGVKVRDISALPPELLGPGP